MFGLTYDERPGFRSEVTHHALHDRQLAYGRWQTFMIRVSHLFESHLTVSNLERAVSFYRDVLGLSPAAVFVDARVAFFWIGGPGQSMLGLWEAGHSPQRM